MYSWNKKEIKKDIEKLKIITPKNNKDIYDIDYCINMLYKLLNNEESNENNLYEENEEYKELRFYNNIINPILNKYLNKQSKKENYKTIFNTKKQILTITKETINNINPNWYNLLLPLFHNSNILNYKHNNKNIFYFIDYINKIFISLDKNNNIEDYIYPIHEYFHALTIILNPNYLYNIEYEFLSILGELIISHEMKQKNHFQKEFIKTELNSYSYILELIKAIILKRCVINSNVKPKNKINYIHKNTRLSKDFIINLYDTSLSYSYSTVISYFLAIELFEIYKLDKEKCIYICESIIQDPNTLETKLSKNNINLLENDNKYIKTLKKEYVKYNL